MRFFVTCIASPEEIVNLRKKVYFLRYSEKVKLEKLEWNKVDELALHSSMHNYEKIISTMRALFFKEIANIEEISRIRFLKKYSSPFVIFTKAATDPDYEGLHLNAILRIHTMEYCLKYGIYNVIGSLRKSSKRLKYLLSSGYEIENEGQRWENSYLSSDEPVVMIVLSGKDKIEKFIELERNRINYKKKSDEFTHAPIFLDDYYNKLGDRK